MLLLHGFGAVGAGHSRIGDMRSLMMHAYPL
ncbi:hypothetical protein FB381_4681 [Nocardioides albertanoniae]|uniref:Uncharacterized protein n=1 Tax=Nocardioides albertanoniae TaxID=1175486 RepID=A0A543ADS9_9ACTN|nr:hypothetical protein FB381_4681 [Nocardioides albertanoniae]